MGCDGWIFLYHSPSHALSHSCPALPSASLPLPPPACTELRRRPSGGGAAPLAPAQAAGSRGSGATPAAGAVRMGTARTARAGPGGTGTRRAASLPPCRRCRTLLQRRRGRLQRVSRGGPEGEGERFIITGEPTRLWCLWDQQAQVRAGGVADQGTTERKRERELCLLPHGPPTVLIPYDPDAGCAHWRSDGWFFNAMPFFIHLFLSLAAGTARVCAPCSS